MRRILLLSFMVFMLGFTFAKDTSEKVPDFSLKSLRGEAVSLSYYTKDKDVSFLVFFTTWCPWCTKQMQTFEEMSQDTNSKDVLFIAIGMENEPKKVINKINSLGVNYPVVLGTNTIAEYFNVSGIPVTVVIDKAGNKLEQVVGFREKKYFSKYLLKK